ncbi:hypothetical protein J2803_001206 [Paraburkholderia phenoliruptrix]|nr:hypothetical protein [Paraburkholderia phenoliruptrix]
MTPEECVTEFQLKRLNMPAQGWLRDADSVGGRAQRMAFRHGDKHTQLRIMAGADRHRLR